MTYATDVRYWHKRADEVRVLAERMQSETARNEMLDLAQSYDRLADNAEDFVRLFSSLKTDAPASVPQRG